MKNSLFELVDFEKVNVLLEGFNKTTGFVTAILDLDGNVLSKSGWRKMCTDFHRINPETAQKCGISDTVLANKLATGDKFHFYKCLNGLVDVAVPIVINGEHIANLFSGQFFFEEPDRLFFEKQAKKYGFDEKKYMEALDKVPVIPKEKVEVAMDFLLNMTQIISDTGFQKMEQIQLNKALKESEERFQLLFNKAPLGYQSLNINGCFIEVNQQWLDTLGYERDEVLGKWFGDFMPPAYQELVKINFPKFLAQGHIHSEFEMVHKNGSILFIAFDGRIGNDSNGNFKQTHCILQDVTESKRVKEALLEAEWKFKALFELGPIGVAYHRMIYDETGAAEDYYFIDANASYKELTGVNPIGMTVRQAFPGIENDPSDWIGMFGHVAKTGKTIRFEQFLESNQRWYDCVGYQYKPDHFVAAFSEITKRKEAEIALKESEEKYRILFESNNDGITIFTAYPDGKVSNFIEMNESAGAMLGYTKAELSAMNPSEIETDVTVEKMEHRLNDLKTKGFSNFETSLRHKNDSIVPVEITVQVINYNNLPALMNITRDISDRKKAEITLKENEEKFRNFFENSVVGKSITSIDGKLSVNKAFCNIVGYSKAELENFNWKEITYKDDIDLNATIVNSLLRGEKESARWEKRYIHKDGHIVWTDISTTLQRDDKGNPLYFITAVIDITERKKAEKALNESKKMLEQVINCIPQFIFWKDRNSVYLGSNENFARAAGLKSAAEIIGKTDYNMSWKKEEADFFVECDNRVMDSGIGEYNIIEPQLQADGKQAWLETNKVPIFDENGQVIGILGTYEDITERKKAEETLRKSEERYSNLLLHLETGIVVHAPDTSIITNNPRACELLGLTSDQMKGKTAIDPAWKFVNADNTPLKLEDYPVNRIVKSKSSILNQILGVHKSINDDIEWLTVNGFPVLSNEGEIIEIVISFNDITERKKAEVLLENERALYLDLVNTQPAGIYRIRVFPKASWEADAWTKADTPPFKIELISDRFCEILEIDPQRFESHPGILVDLVHPDDKEEFVRRNDAANTTVSIFNWDCRLLINNKIKWVHFESLPRKLENGDILFTGIIFDITDSKNAAEALRKSEEMMLSSQTVAHICSYSTNLNVNEIEKSAWVCSPEFYNIFGMDETYPHTIAGWVGFLHPDHRDEVAAYHESVVKNRTSFNHEYKIIRINDGAERWVHGTGELEYDEHNNPVRMYGAIQDITERKKTEEQISIQLNELRRWYEVTLDREGRVLELKNEVNELLKMHGEALRYGNNIEDSL